MLILIINLIILQVPLSDCFKKVEPFALVNIGDYYVPEYNLSIFGVNFYESGNIIMHVYSYIKNLKICIEEEIFNQKTFTNCQSKGSLDPQFLNNSDINFGSLSANQYFIFQKQEGYIRIFNDNYECKPKLSIESSICFDFYNSYNKLKIKLSSPLPYDIYLNIQYFSNSMEEKFLQQFN